MTCSCLTCTACLTRIARTDFADHVQPVSRPERWPQGTLTGTPTGTPIAAALGTWQPPPSAIHHVTLCCDRPDCGVQYIGTGKTPREATRDAHIAAEARGWQLSRFGELALHLCSQHAEPTLPRKVQPLYDEEGMPIDRRRT